MNALGTLLAEWLWILAFINPSFHRFLQFLRKRGFAQAVVIVSDTVKIALSDHVTLRYRVCCRSNNSPIAPMHRKRSLSDNNSVRVRDRTTVAAIR